MPWWKGRRAHEVVTSANESGPSPPEDVAHLADWLRLLAPGGPLLDDAVRVIGQLLRSVPTSALSRIDLESRASSRWDDDGWRRLDPKSVDDMAASTGDSLGVAAAASMHRNGRVREAAVRLLASLTDGTELRWLVLRCLDCVPEVVAVAEPAVRARLDAKVVPRSAASTVDLLPLLGSGRFSRTATSERLRQDVLTAVLRPVLRQDLWDASASADRALRRAAVRLLVETKEDPLRLLQTQLEKDDVVASSDAAQAALSHEATCADAAAILSFQPAARLRELALWHLVSHHHDYSDVLGTALLDRAAGVRDLAQRILVRDGTDPAQWYRDQLDAAPEGALLGLGDCGSERDADEGLHRLATSGRLAAAATRLVARQGSRETTTELIDLSIHGSGSVAREAILGLHRHGVSDAVVAEAWAKADSSSGAAKRRIGLRLLPRAGRWSRLEVGLRALVSDDEETRELGATVLARTLGSWNLSATAPTTPQLTVIRDLLNTVGDAYEPLRIELADMLRHW